VIFSGAGRRPPGGSALRLDAFRAVDPTLFYFSIVGMCEHPFAARSLLAEEEVDLDDALIEHFTQHTIELLLHGIASE
jgi:hypothetical protein